LVPPTAVLVAEVLGAGVLRTGIDAPCPVDEHTIGHQACTWRHRVWRGTAALIEDLAARTIIPAALVEVDIPGDVALHADGVCAQDITVRRAKLTSWCDACWREGFWMAGELVVGPPGTRGLRLISRCVKHVGNSPRVSPQALGKWLGYAVAAPTPSLDEALRTAMPTPWDRPVAALLPTPDRRVGHLRMGQVGWVDVEHFRVDGPDLLIVATEAPAPQVPNPTKSAIPVQRTLALGLDTHVDAPTLGRIADNGQRPLLAPVARVRMVRPPAAPEPPYAGGEAATTLDLPGERQEQEIVISGGCHAFSAP